MTVEAYFAQRMRDLRTLQGVSQKALADKLSEHGSIDASAVCRIEKNIGDMAILRMEKGARAIRLGEAVAIADALGVPLSEMLPPGAGGERRQILALPDALVDRLRALHEAAGAALRLADPGGGQVLLHNPEIVTGSDGQRHAGWVDQDTGEVQFEPGTAHWAGAVRPEENQMSQKGNHRSEKRKRNTLVAIRLLPDEAKLLTAAAQASGLPLSRYIREAAMDNARMEAVESAALHGEDR